MAYNLKRLGALKQTHLPIRVKDTKAVSLFPFPHVHDLSSTTPTRGMMEVKQSRFVEPGTPSLATADNNGFQTCATLPDLFVDFIAPEPEVNPYYEEVKAESEAWMRANLWKDLSEKEIRKRCAADFCYFSAIMCPDAAREEFRTVCDWIFWVFEFDDQFDEGELGKDRAKGLNEVEGMISIFRDHQDNSLSLKRPRIKARSPTSVLAEDVVMRLEIDTRIETNGDNLRERKDSMNVCERELDGDSATHLTPIQNLFCVLWTKVQQKSPRNTKLRYIKANVNFCRSVAELHGEKFDDMVVMDNISRYLQVRAQNIGLYPLLALEEYAYGLSLPTKVFEDEGIQEVERLVAEMLTLQNDILSYHREYSVGHEENLISIFRRRLGLTQQESYDKADALLHGCYRQWYIAHSKIPSWGEKIDVQVQRYLKACVDVLRANVHWSYKSQRYFGKDVQRVRETRQVPFIP
ncbi:terpenoid synthase [Saccharata proteae CBS 121410]|uniref:Terpene synthase n=1 Tax=Saccharata proteae CBS 121410 TaxID=1314787 RepID=A0A9P4HR98_9PEZI|nr:terpenoid synthase [Saccharata proteae CBS 121410]